MIDAGITGSFLTARLVSKRYYHRWMPGAFSSPFLLGAAVFLHPIAGFDSSTALLQPRTVGSTGAPHFSDRDQHTLRSIRALLSVWALFLQFLTSSADLHTTITKRVCIRCACAISVPFAVRYI